MGDSSLESQVELTETEIMLRLSAASFLPATSAAKRLRLRSFATTACSLASDNRNFYQILGVAQSATQDEVKAAFRQKTLQNHPDKFPGDKLKEEEFKRINEAYQALARPSSRRKYNAAKRQNAAESSKSSRKERTKTKSSGRKHNPFDNYHKEKDAYYSQNYAKQARQSDAHSRQSSEKIYTYTRSNKFYKQNTGFQTPWQKDRAEFLARETTAKLRDEERQKFYEYMIYRRKYGRPKRRRKSKTKIPRQSCGWHVGDCRGMPHNSQVTFTHRKFSKLLQ